MNELAVNSARYNAEVARAQAADAEQRAAEANRRSAEYDLLPHVCYGASVYKTGYDEEGKEYACHLVPAHLVGSDGLHLVPSSLVQNHSIIGYGSTPAEACAAFDQLWTDGECPAGSGHAFVTEGMRSYCENCGRDKA